MLDQSQITIQLDPATIARLNEFAQNQNRSGDAIIEEALNGYLKHMAWLEAEIEKGRKDIREGRFYTQEEVEEKFRKLGVNLD